MPIQAAVKSAAVKASNELLQQAQAKRAWAEADASLADAARLADLARQRARAAAAKAASSQQAAGRARAAAERLAESDGNAKMQVMLKTASLKNCTV
jgi:colicin import membrane protein